MINLLSERLPEEAILDPTLVIALRQGYQMV
jgi:hypothetical protein